MTFGLLGTHTVDLPQTEQRAVRSDATGSVPTFSDAAADPEVRELVLRASKAHTALMRGDLVQYRSLIMTTDDFTLMAPFGGTPTRATDLTDERWAAVASFFKNGRDTSLQLVQAYRSAGLVVLAVIERGHVEVGGLAGQDWSLRVTLVFRKEKDQWLLAHRHADPLVEGLGLEQAAELTRGRSSS